LDEPLKSLYSSHLMIEALSVASMAAVSYVSTNFDNLAILSVFSVKPGYRPLYVKATFVIVCLTVLVVSLLLAKAAASSGFAEHVRYLGLIPISLGGYQLLNLLTGRADDEGAEAVEVPAAMGFPAYLGFALVLLANSGDSISVMTPLLADLKPSLVLASFIAAIVVALVMTWLSHLLSRHPLSRTALERLAKWALPFLLIAIGALILSDAPAELFSE
jgi:cadmium resistance protein CadD (predicted permease)